MRLLVITILTASSLLVLGCAGTTRLTGNIEYFPQQFSALSALHKKTVLIIVKDERPAEEKGYIGNFENTYWNTNDPIELIMSNALKQEFEKHNNKIVSNEDSSYDVSLVVTLKRVRAQMYGTIKVANIDSLVSIRQAKKTDTVSSFPARGFYKLTVLNGVLVPKFSDELKGAIDDFVQNLTFDSRFIEMFQ